jgi:hypothetical protein
MDFGRNGAEVWAGFIGLRTGSARRFLSTQKFTFGFLKRQGVLDQLNRRGKDFAARSVLVSLTELSVLVR